ncbi:MAG: glycosyltransferase family 1 protein [Chloroflexota bacterium]
MPPAGQIVALDVAPVRAQPAGVGLYAARLARALAEAGAEIALIGLRPDASALAGLPLGIPQRPFRLRTYHAWMQGAAEGQARSVGASLAHFTNAAAPLLARLPYVVTVHDLSVARLPGTHPRLRWPIVGLNLAAIARARAIIVPSRFSARELGRLGVAERRVCVIPHAPTIARPAPGTASSLELHGTIVAGQYILFVGTIEPRKNIERLVAAFEQLGAARPELRLVLAGAPGWRFLPIERRINASPLRERILRLGYVAEDELLPLIANSAAVAYVSLYEGFGMPVLDALAAGAPVVTSRRTAMPEAGLGAAILVDPDSVEDIRRGLEEALLRRPELVALGLERAAARHWEDVAREHQSVYRFASGRSG